MTRIHAERALLPDGWARDVAVIIEDGRIVAATPDAVPGQDATGASILLPAPANLHSHAFQRAMAGMTEARGPSLGPGARDSFWTWRTLMYRFLDRLGPEDVEAIAALVYVEMLEAGYAAVAEFHYLHHDVGGVPYENPAELSDRIAAAAAETGIGLTLLPVLYCQGGTDGRELAGRPAPLRQRHRRLCPPARGRRARRAGRRPGRAHRRRTAQLARRARRGADRPRPPAARRAHPHAHRRAGGRGRRSAGHPRRDAHALAARDPGRRPRAGA